MEGRIRPASTDLIQRIWQERWGLPIITPIREYLPPDVEGLAWRDAEGEAQGLVTWATEGDCSEIVTMDALVQGRRIGGRLLDGAEAELRRRGVRRVIIATTNDNPRALGFYIRRGYRLVRLHLDAMDAVRRAKPQVPALGNDGIPLRDMWELEKRL